MTSLLFSHLLLPFVIAMFLAITMGGSGTAPSFSVAYGANLIRKNLIPGLFGLMVFAGAIVAGKNTSVTIGKDILPSEIDRKSTRLNSSHVRISYAVFCLKKKKQQ